MLVIEGADNLGKTTAAQKIVAMAALRAQSRPESFFPIRYTHMTRPNEAFDFFADYQDMVSKYAVQDRFHLGGLVWHQNKIDNASLRIIEGWLYSLGSFIVVFYSDDDVWYRRHLSDNQKKEMFKPQVLEQANRTFRMIAQGEHPARPAVDLAININGRKGFPSDSQLETILDAWSLRLERITCRR